MKKTTLATFAIALLLLSCSPKKEKSIVSTKSGLDKAKFQADIDGKKTGLYTLTNAKGMEVCITNFGGRIVSVMVPDKSGNMIDVVYGFDSIQDYINIPNKFGATIGRYANRIADAKFELDGTIYTLTPNSSVHSMHGGAKGYHCLVFDAKQTDDQSLELTYLSEDGEEGFPGNLNNKVVFSLTDNNEIRIDYEATTDKPTVINLTNHSYFNLTGDTKSTNPDWMISINADSYTPIDSTLATTGEILPVEGTIMDLRTPRPIDLNINNGQATNKKKKGYDHNWVLNTKGDINQVAATLISPLSGVKLEVFTTEPGIQFYVANFSNSTLTGKKGIGYNNRPAVCLETQKYPDTPNKKGWPSASLRPGDTFRSQTIFKFSVEK